MPDASADLSVLRPDAPPSATSDAAPNDRPGGVRGSWVLTAVVLSLAATALVSFHHGFDGAALWAFAHRISAGTVALVAALLALRLWIGGQRLRHLSGGALTRAQGLRGQLAWEFFSAVTPPVIGGGPLVAVFLTRDARLRGSEATLTVLSALAYEQVWTTLSVAVLLGASLVLPVFPASLPPWATASIVVYLVSTGVWAGMLVFAVFFRPDAIERAVRWASRHRWLARHRDRIEHEAADLRRRARLLHARGVSYHGLGLLYTAAAWVVRYGMLVVVVKAVVPSLDVLLFVLREVAMMITSFATPTPGSAGGAEALYAVFLGPLIEPRAMVAPTLLVWRFVNFYAFLPLGLYLTGLTIKARRAQVGGTQKAVVETDH